MNTSVEQLNDIIDRIRGKLRNYDELAGDCGIGVATIYRLKRGDFKKYPSEDILRSLVTNADPTGNVTYEELLTAINNVLEHCDIDTPAISRKARRDTQRAEKIFFDRLGAFRDAFLPAGEIQYPLAPNSSWDGLMEFSEGNEKETWLFDVKSAYGRSYVPWNMLSSSVGLYALREGPDLSQKWLHIVIASPLPSVNENCLRFNGIESAVPVSILPFCTTTGQIFPEIILYKGRSKKRIEF